MTPSSSSRLDAPTSPPGQPLPVLIRKAAVLGAGTMGARIAAHLANAGVAVLLLDLPARDGGPLPAAKALETLLRAKPAAFYDPENALRIATGGFDDGLRGLSGCDWVIEAVTEDLAIKQALLTRAAPHVKPGAILSTNTSGLSVERIAEALPQPMRRRWLGTHFFNPPRYMRLVELIPAAETDPAVTAGLAAFLSHRMGKTTVIARDTPNFIANRIGVFVLAAAIGLMQRQDLTIEEVDVLTGGILGWPRTGTFRLADMVGLDVLAHVAANFATARCGEKLALPPFLGTMIGRGWLGDKAGQGFYRKAGSERLALDWRTLEYRPAARAKFPSVDLAKNAERLPERLPMLLSGDARKDKAAAFHWPLLAQIWNYAANCLPEIADSPAAIDCAMRAGFNWTMGPFAMWDAAGVGGTVERMRREGIAVSPSVEKLLQSGAASWYRDGGESAFEPASGEFRPVAREAGATRVAGFRRANGVIEENPGASLIDLGGGIACIELHAKKNAIGEDIVSFVTRALHPEGEHVRGFEGFVVTGDADDFSVGANLFQVLLAIQEADWEEIDLAVRAFQRMTAAIKFCPRPAVVAPFGMCLGGGCEMALHAARRQPHAELYMGLVEAGVGLVPAGGGTKEMALRAADAAAAVLDPGERDAAARLAASPAYLDAVRRGFAMIGMARVSTSAAEARRMGLLSAGDRVTMHRDRLLEDAKRMAQALANGYAPPAPRHIPAAGVSALSTLTLGVHLMRQAGRISEHDQVVARHAAHILCGGAASPGTPLSEEHLLDLEREAFLSLCGEPKTQERIAFTLKTGKPLRN